jgi:hypothetical protein
MQPRSRSQMGHHSFPSLVSVQFPWRGPQLGLRVKHQSRYLNRCRRQTHIFRCPVHVMYTKRKIINRRATARQKSQSPLSLESICGCRSLNRETGQCLFRSDHTATQPHPTDPALTFFSNFNFPKHCCAARLCEFSNTESMTGRRRGVVGVFVDSSIIPRMRPSIVAVSVDLANFSANIRSLVTRTRSTGYHH